MNFEIIKHYFDEDITLYFISDVHLGALEHCKDEWASFRKNILSQKNAYLVLGGDLVNNGVRTCSFINPYDELIRPREQKKMMVEHLMPLAEQKKILAVVSGNHEARSMKDDDVDLTYDICAKLDIEHLYRYDTAFIKLSLGTRRRDSSPICSYNIALTHGAGGGIYTGASVNRNERFGNVVEGIDILAVGHSHKGAITRPSKIVFDGRNDVVSVKSYVVIGMVSWLNYGGYALQKMLLPSEVANPQKVALRKSEKKQIITLW